MWDVNNDETGTFGICAYEPCNVSFTINGATSSCSNNLTQLCSSNTYTSYAWSTGATTQCITPSASGTYTVTVTDASGCTASQSQTITVHTPPTASITGPDSSCTSAPGQLCASGGVTYLWSNSSTASCINPPTGTYTVVVTDANGCTATASKTTTVYTNPTVSITGNSTACAGSNIQLCATSGVFTYSWTGGSVSPCINASTSGTYVVTITDAHGCTATASKAVTIFSPVSVSVTGPTTACSADIPQLCTNTTFSAYLWSNGSTTQCMNPAASGNYSVTVTDANGCTASANATITINTSPTMSITGPVSECSNSNAQLCVVGSFASIVWSNLSSSQCINVSNTGSYAATITDANGCTASASHSITIFQSPSINITGQSQVCPGTTVLLCANTASGTLLWSDSSTSACISTSKDTTFTVTVTDANNCTASASHSVTYYTPPDATISGATAACFGSTVQVCAPAGPFIYQWSTGETTPCINLTASGTYTVSVTDANGCVSVGSHTLSIGSSLNLSILGPAGKCPGQTVNLCASVAGTTLWSNGSTTQCISPITSGTYTVTVTDANGCSGSASKSFTVYPTFSATITGPSTACYNSNPSLCAPTGASYTYLWSTGETTRCINANASGVYSVTITNINGCTASDSQGLTIFSPLNATISGPNSVCIGTVANLCAPTGSTSYAWSTGSTSRCINVNSTGTYTVTITDGNGCTASNSLLVTFASSITTTITGPHNVCSGGTAELCVPSGYTTYAWSNGSTSECINVTTGGIYSVTIHDAVGCVANDTQLVTIIPNPSVFISGLLTLCPGDSTDLCATSGFASYEWQDNSTNRCLTVNAAGNYSVQVTDSNGCTASNSATISISNINPNITQTPSGLIASPTGLQYQYTWFFNDTLFTGCTGDTCTPNHTGFYKVLVYDLISGCTDSATLYYDAIGINENDGLNTVHIYPNPISGDKLFIEFSQPLQRSCIVTMYDAMGKAIVNDVWKELDQTKKEIDMSHFSAGVYLIQISEGNAKFSRRIVKSY
ncbi:MAG: T9SS type A sorting domain-containing protein [Bacteroidetes bacterium]|nr:T9SS type A sorting domain-containing protein [Bacteroidota bacterium]